MAELEWANTIGEIRESLLNFSQALAAGDERTVWASPHAEYYVYDPENQAFAPCKFAAFRGMTVERYAELQELQRTKRQPPRFDGGAARRSLTRLLGGRDFGPDETLFVALREKIASGLGERVVANYDSGRRLFVVLEPAASFWWVNQGQTHVQEIGGGFIWAPQKSKKGQILYHWRNVFQVKAGDVIFHYFGRGISAVSLASRNGGAASRPDSISGDAWESQGWLAPVDVTLLQDPLLLTALAAELASLEVPQGPLANDNSVKQGYLFNLTPEAASLLVSKLPPGALPDSITSKLGAPKNNGPIPGGPQVPDNVTLNRVLYGPPGTGKTYLSMQVAVEICGGTPRDTRAEIVQRYAELQEAGRIRFVTFHQSYGYEEFVEGLRPVLMGEGEATETSRDIQYECRPGLFRRLCDAAQDVRARVQGDFQIDPHQHRVWKMSLGNTLDPETQGMYDDCIEGNYLWLGYGAGLDFTGCNTREAVLDKLRSIEPTMAPNDYNVTSVNIFKNKMQIGDVVIVTEGNYKFRAIGRVAGDYRAPKDPEDGQRRDAEWLAILDPSLSYERILRNVFSQASIYQLKPAVLKLAELNALLGDPDPTPQNYVLIIDEINRGNISKILGELITLLEPDKRLGAANELRVRLPYSQDEFGVPGNLYVVGTMNTADRSIAFLDTALRRRFEFREIMPDSAVIRRNVPNEGQVNGIDIAALCDEINKRIELLYDRDHTIGHAYFLKVASLTDLRDLFTKKLIPLLQEYFYGDWHKLSQVLGCTFNPDDGKPAVNNPYPMVKATPLDPQKLIPGNDGSVDLRIRCEVNPGFRTADESQLADYFRPLLTA